MTQRQLSQMNNSGMVLLIVQLKFMLQDQQVINEFHCTKFDYFYSVFVKMITIYAPTYISYWIHSRISNVGYIILFFVP